MTETTPESTVFTYGELTPLQQLIRRRDSLIAAARAIPVAVVDPDDDPVLCHAKRKLLEAAGKLFLQIQRLERKGNV
jgi:hypothetical protein